MSSSVTGDETGEFAGCAWGVALIVVIDCLLVIALIKAIRWLFL